MCTKCTKDKVTTFWLVAEVAQRMGCYKKDARELLQHFSDVVGESIQAGKKVQFTGLGVFYPVVSKRGAGAVKFRPATSLMGKVQEQDKTH